MLFLTLTLSFVVGSLLASGIAVIVMCKLFSSPKFFKWYLNWFKNVMEKYEEELEDLI